MPPPKCWEFPENHENWNKAKMGNFPHNAEIWCLKKCKTYDSLKREFDAGHFSVRRQELETIQ